MKTKIFKKQTFLKLDYDNGIADQTDYKIDFTVRQPDTEQTTTTMDELTTVTTELNAATAEQLKKISDDLRYLDKTIEDLQKDYDQIKTNIRSLLDFKQQLLTPETLETLKSDLENLSTTFKDQSIKTNNTLTELQFQIDEINESLFELVKSRALYSYQNIIIDKSSFKRKNTDNFDKSESIFDFYLLINDFSKNFEIINNFMNRIDTNESTNFDSEYLESMFENMTISLTKMKKDFVTLPLDFNLNATKELYQLISKIENHFVGIDNEDVITSDSLDSLKSRFQALNLDVKNIKKLYVRIYNVNLYLKMINQEIVSSVQQMMVILNSMLLSVEDFDNFSNSKF